MSDDDGQDIVSGKRKRDEEDDANEESSLSSSSLTTVQLLLSQWKGQTNKLDKEQVAVHLAKELKLSFKKLLPTDNNNDDDNDEEEESDDYVALFECPDTNGIELALIFPPPKGCDMGLSNAMEEQLYESIMEHCSSDEELLTYEDVLETDDGQILQSVSNMRPTQIIHPKPFLLATTPLTYRQAKSYLPNCPEPDYLLDKDDDDDDDDDEDRVIESAGVYLSDRQVQLILLDRRFRLPSESEWEYVAREGGKKKERLFPFDCCLGGKLPTEEDMIWYYYDDDEEKGDKNNNNKTPARNALGVMGMGQLPELCADLWQETLEGMPQDGSPRLTTTNSFTIRPIRTVRGGALGGWQDCGEWANYLVCQRYPQNQNHPVALRLAMDVIPDAQHKSVSSSIKAKLRQRK